MFLPLLKEVHPLANQLIINWYDGGSEYTPMHHDCLDGMDRTAGVTIVSFNCREGKRTLIFKPNNIKANKDYVIEYEQDNGTWININGPWLTEWRHGIAKQPDTKGRRVSLSFRTYHHDAGKLFLMRTRIALANGKE